MFLSGKMVCVHNLCVLSRYNGMRICLRRGLYVFLAGIMVCVYASEGAYMCS